MTNPTPAERKKSRQSQLSIVLCSIENGAETIDDVANDTGLPRKHISAYLCHLKRDGILVAIGKKSANPGKRDWPHMMNVFRLAEGVL